MSNEQRPIPMIDDLALEYVARARQSIRQRIVPLAVAGLDGEVQQVLGRASHQIELAGVIVGEDAADKLGALQKKAASGEESDFTADITTALELSKVIVVAADFEEQAGRPGYFDYRLILHESPPLPPPAELASLGGLAGADLGFDADILTHIQDDIANRAGELQNAIETVSDTLDTLQSLAGLGDLSLSNPLTPMSEEAGKLGSSGAGAVDAGSKLGGLLGGQ